MGRGTVEGMKFLGPAFFAPGTEADYGGTVNVVVLHVVTAFFRAPLLIEALLLLTVLYCSIAWILFISLLAGVHSRATHQALGFGPKASSRTILSTHASGLIPIVRR